MLMYGFLKLALKYSKQEHFDMITFGDGLRSIAKEPEYADPYSVDWHW